MKFKFLFIDKRTVGKRRRLLRHCVPRNINHEHYLYGHFCMPGKRASEIYLSWIRPGYYPSYACDLFAK